MKKNRIVYYLGAFGINLVIISLIFWSNGLVPLGNNNFLTSDLGTQYIAFLTELRRQLVNGNLHLYLFSQSLGDNFFPIISYYLLSPFNLLLVLFKAQAVPVAADVIIMLKISAMGVSMAYFLTQYFKQSRPSNYIFTIAYSFCGFVASYFYDLMWLDALIMLPIVAVGVMRVIQQNKYVLYYFSILFSIIFNYYLGYMLCIFSVCFFIYLSLENNLMSQRTRFVTIANYLATSILAGLSSAVVLVPTLAGMLKTAKTSFNGFNYLPSARFGLEAFTQLGIGGNTFIQRLHHGPSVFMTSTVLILLLSYFFSNRVSKSDKSHSLFLIGILLASMFVTTFNTIWHMFQNPAGFPFRNSFIFSFVCIFVAHKAFSAGVFKDKVAIIKATCTAGILICIGYTTEWLIPKLIERMHYETPDNAYNGYYFWLSLICIIVSGILIILFNKNKYFGILILLMISFESFANFNSVLDTAYLGNQKVYSRQYKRENNILKEVKKNSAPGHRIIVSKSGLNKAFPEQYNNYNDPVLFNINGMSLYSSTLNQDTMTMMNNLGYFSYNVRRISYFGGTNITNTLFGVHYNISQLDNKYIVNEHYDAPTLGFLVNKDVYDFQMISKRALDNQNRLWQSLNGTKTQYLKNASIMTMSQNDVKKRTMYTYQLKTETTGPLYFYVSPFNYHASRIYVNGRRLNTPQVQVQKAAVMDLGNFKKNESIEVKILTSKPLEINPSYFRSLDYDEYESTIDKFKNNSLKVSSNLNHDVVKGTINVKQSSPLLLSVPYDNGWSAYDNGKKVKIHKVVDDLMAIDLDKGYHKVELKYQVPGLKLGWIISVMSMLIFAIYLRFNKYLNKKYSKIFMK
ncbi:YfhO family protein [Companilactobacillus jidongensis]|uniref:YfhO family protein n=1 Tax=Companilactobacillus jidongensis TaxID=2486006 RepID=UPI000F77E494|nr:YfhO family protein [Companilactobacillus jidongensis]